MQSIESIGSIAKQKAGRNHQFSKTTDAYSNHSFNKSNQ